MLSPWTRSCRRSLTSQEVLAPSKTWRWRRKCILEAFEGLQYYTSLQPQNPYDRNAVMVELAAPMAYIMDNKVVLFGQTNKFSMCVNLTFWGREGNGESVHSHMKCHGYRLSTTPKGRPVISLSQKSVVQLLRTPLMTNQRQALCRMASWENNKDLPPFCEQKSELYFNMLMNFAERKATEGPWGEDFVSNFYNRKPLPLEKCVRMLAYSRMDKRPLFLFQCYMCSLQAVMKLILGRVLQPESVIVCPLSLISNWLDQFEQHVWDDVNLKVYLYWGPQWLLKGNFLSGQDIVLTTYNMLFSDCGVTNGPLHKVSWLRVVLDEDYIIRNPNALQRGFLHLTSSIWPSGTPVKYCLNDVWMLIAFLKLQPFDVREWWTRVIQRPVTMEDKAGLKYRQYCSTHKLTQSGHGVLNLFSLWSGDTGSPSELQDRLISKITVVMSFGSDDRVVQRIQTYGTLITYCAHVFCRPCICEVISSGQVCTHSLPVSHLPFSKGITFVMTKLLFYKVDALMSNLLKLHSEYSTIKCLVVSQFKFLTLLSASVVGSPFKPNIYAIDKQCRIWKTSPGSPTIMLLSLKAGGVGLNLTAASQVFLMEPAWNPGAEDQCVDGCYQLGQTRDVIITKFIVKDLVEENRVRIQKRKHQLVENL
uniref:Helicase-like transcription factor n=1 Tax=Electrophorus electricus TaxID=8005 RepID=A0A4W4EDH8_ELEEL